MYFKYGTVSSGKSLELLKVAYNYEEQNKNVLVLTSSLDDRYGFGKIASRVGLDRDAHIISSETDIMTLYNNELEELNKHLGIADEPKTISCILVDESQFLSKHNIQQLALIVDEYDTPVIAYGLKVDFSNNLFEGSNELFVQADKIEEIKTICTMSDCEKKATMNIRMDEYGKALYRGEQVQIGGSESYVPVCRHHYYNFN